MRELYYLGVYNRGHFIFVNPQTACVLTECCSKRYAADPKKGLSRQELRQVPLRLWAKPAAEGDDEGPLCLGTNPKFLEFFPIPCDTCLCKRWAMQGRATMDGLLVQQSSIFFDFRWLLAFGVQLQLRARIPGMQQRGVREDDAICSESIECGQHGFRE